jgi:outer membrane autotransporter protein
MLWAVWARANAWYADGDFGKMTMTTLEGTHPTSFKQAKGGAWLGIEAGVNARVTQNTSLFATASYEHGVSGGRKGDHGFGGRVGLQVRF